MRNRIFYLLVQFSIAIIKTATLTSYRSPLVGKSGPFILITLFTIQSGYLLWVKQ